VLQLVDEGQFDAVTFELDRHTHFPARKSAVNVLAPAAHPAGRMPGAHLCNGCLSLPGQFQSLTPEQKLAFVEHLAASQALLALPRPPFVFQGQRVSPAGFSHELLKIAAVEDGLFHVASQFIGNVNGKTSIPAAPVQREAGMPLPRFTEGTMLSNTRAFPQ
jgi:hypothetical protein